jgi:transglutaminase-like putative cysteine protease
MSMLHRLYHLPREARDTLFLLLVIAWVMLPLSTTLPAWCSACAVLILIWRGWIAVRGKSLPSRWWLLLLLLLASGATYASHRTLMGRDAGVTFIVVLLALKTLEMRASRDTFVVFFLGFFTLLANFFFSQSLLTAAAMVVGLLGLLTALVNHHMPVGRPPLLQAARTAGGMALLGAPIMVLLFVLFPRIAPLWGMPGDAASAHTGLSNSMQVGSIANLALDDSVAMRIRFEGAVPPQSALYFRGPVLASFDGREWSPLRSAFPAHLQLASRLQVSGEPVRYEVTLEGNNQTWLPLLDAAPQRPELQGNEARMGADLQWRASSPLNGLQRFKAQSYIRFNHGPLQSELGLQDMLDLPPGYNPRTLQLAQDMRRDPRYANAPAASLVEAVLQRLRTGGYRYTLEPGVYGSNTADEFWFDRKEGFCEHIASSFVLLMRALDIPARVVTGYQGGEVNGVDGFWTVRQSDAHAWAEVWLAGQGWVRVDPTAAVAPGRTGTQQRLQQPRGAVAQALGAISPGFEINLRALWEASNNRWNQWVLNYSQTSQLQLLRNIGFEAPDWQDLGTLLMACIVSASLAGAAWAHWSRSLQDPWLRLLHAASQRLQQAGLPVTPDTPPRQLAQALAACAKGLTPAQQRLELESIRDWLLRLEAWRYGAPAAAAQSPAATLVTLRRQFRQLRWPQSLPLPASPTNP